MESLGSPTDVPLRSPETFDEFEKGEDIASIRQKYAEATANSDATRLVVWAGAGVSAMNKILPAKVSFFRSTELSAQYRRRRLVGYCQGAPRRHIERSRSI